MNGATEQNFPAASTKNLYRTIGKAKEGRLANRGIIARLRAYLKMIDSAYREFRSAAFLCFGRINREFGGAYQEIIILGRGLIMP